MNGLDRAAFHYVNGWPDGLTPFMRFWSEGISTLPVRGALLLLLVILALRPTLRRGALVAGLGWPLANLLTDVLKHAVPFARPAADLPDVIARVGMAQTMGTASAHAANMAFVAACFCYYFRWWGLPWVGVALCVGFSRVYVGAHYPSQVVLGWLCGLFAAMVVIGCVESVVRLRRARAEEVSEEQDDEQGD